VIETIEWNKSTETFGKYVPPLEYKMLNQSKGLIVVNCILYRQVIWACMVIDHVAKHVVDV
jgi:hypothetical protein